MSSLSETRLAICRTCPLFRKTWEGTHRCDGTKYMNPETKETSYLPKKGYVKGCNCLCEMKANNPSAHCVAGLW